MAENSVPTAPSPDDRSRRVYVWWGAGFAFLAALGLFCWLVVGPAVEVHRVAAAMPVQGYFPARQEAAAAVARLGGPERAARKISIYLRLPAKLTGGEQSIPRWQASALLGCCGKPGLKTILRLFSSSSEIRQACGMWGLMTFTVYRRGEAAFGRGNVIENFREALGDPDPEVCRLAGDLLEVLKARGIEAFPYPK